MWVLCFLESAYKMNFKILANAYLKGISELLGLPAGRDMSPRPPYYPRLKWILFKGTAGTWDSVRSLIVDYVLFHL